MDWNTNVPAMAWLFRAAELAATQVCLVCGTRSTVKCPSMLDYGRAYELNTSCDTCLKAQSAARASCACRRVFDDLNSSKLVVVLPSTEVEVL